MVELMARDGYYMTYSIGTDLTAWDNAQAALVVGEINACDWFYSARLTPTQPATERHNPMTAGVIPKRIVVGKTEGKYQSVHYLQTGIFTYAVMGASTAVAAGVERDITKDTDTIPINFGVHLEKEGTTASKRFDGMGWVPSALDIMVSERQTIAFQTLSGTFAYLVSGAADLAQPAALAQATHGPYTWFHTKNASGATEFSYNGGDLNLDLTEVRLHIGWADKLMGAYDSNGYHTAGWVVPPLDCYVEIGARRTDAAGTDIDTLLALAPASYAGDLDFILDFYESATRYLRYTFDKMYIPRESVEEVFPDETNWYEGVRFRLEFKDENSSLAVKTKDALADTYYTNP